MPGYHPYDAYSDLTPDQMAEISQVRDSMTDTQITDYGGWDAVVNDWRASKGLPTTYGSAGIRQIPSSSKQPSAIPGVFPYGAGSDPSNPTLSTMVPEAFDFDEAGNPRWPRASIKPKWLGEKPSTAKNKAELTAEQQRKDKESAEKILKENRKRREAARRRHELAVQALRPRSVWDGGLGKLAKETASDLEESEIANASMRRQLEESYKERNAAITAEADLKQAEAEKTADLRSYLYAENLKFADRVKDVEDEKRRELEAFEDKFARHQQYKKYALMSPDEVDSYLIMRDNPNMPIEVRAQAKEELDKASRPDPDYGKSFGSKIGAGIAMALGAMGAALARTPNFAMQIIMKQREEIVQSQLKQFEARGEDIKNLKDSFSRSMHVFGDKRQSIMAEKIAFHDQVEQQIEAFKAMSESEQVHARADQLIAANDIERKKLKTDMFATEQANNARTRGQQIQIASARQQGALQQEGLRMRAAAARMKSMGGGGRELPGKIASEIGKLRAGQITLDELANTYRDKVGWLGAFMQFVPLTSEKEYNDERRAAARIVGKIIERGRFSNQDADQYYEMLPNAGDSKTRAMNKIRVITRMLEESARGQYWGLRSAGFNMSKFEELVKDPSKPINTESYSTIQKGAQ